MNSNFFFSCVLYVNSYCSQFFLRNAALKRVAFVFNKSLSLSIAVILTPYLLKRMERVTISVYCDLLFFPFLVKCHMTVKHPKPFAVIMYSCIPALPCLHHVKGPLSATPLFLFTYKNLAIIFYLQHVETKEITFKLLKIIKHTFRNTTYRKTIRFRFTKQCK